MSESKDSDAKLEWCQKCEAPRSMSVRVELIEEKEGVPFSREPYRIITCKVCGEEEYMRMNNL